MKKFRFSLAAVLRVRKIREDERRRVMGELSAIARAQERSIESIAEREREEFGAIARLSSFGTIDVARIRSHAAAAASLRVKAQGEAESLAGTRERMEKERPRLVKAAAERRAIERLREARLEEWKRDVLRAEQHDLDDRAGAARANGGEE